MNKYIKIVSLYLVSMLSLMGCSDDIFTSQELVPEGYMLIEFAASVPEMNRVETKAVDPDGAGVQQISVFCFDENDLFITTVTAELETDGSNPSLTGTIRVMVPEQTSTLQLVGNQNLTYFREDNYRGMSEIDVMSSLEASAGRMIYWARKTLAEIYNHRSVSNPVMLLRNQAKVTLEILPGVDFVSKGWLVVNSNAFGTVAPYSSEYGFVAPHYKDRPFVTLPENRSKLSNYMDVRQVDEEYIFETENTPSAPMDFIIKGSMNGGEDLYYRISFLDDSGEYLKILRNHHYTVNIKGLLNFGQKTFAEAMDAPATNNVWISISDDISEITDGEYTLSVDETSVVIAEEQFSGVNNQYFLYYTLKTTGSSPLTQADVSWVEGNNVAKNSFIHTFDPATGRGTICIDLNEMGQLTKREGTLLVKWERLSRKIKVVTIKEQRFEPAWITTNIYGGATGEHITMMFTIPDECPQELFPLDVVVSVNDIDVRNESGMVLPIITAEDPRYGEDNGIGYKYLLTAERVGEQHLYLRTIQQHQEADSVNVTIEAYCFESLTKTATFRPTTDYSIILDNMYHFSVEIPRDEVLFFYMVPQKINARVEIETHLASGAVWNNTTEEFDYTSVSANPNDQFLFYSQNLNHNDDPSLTQYFNFTEINQENWTSDGRVQLFTRTDVMPTPSNGAVFHLLTNTPKSAEAVRIASNPASSGNQYRSAIFELANFHPFRFSAQINGIGTFVSGESEEQADEIFFDYEPNKDVTIEIDVTSFKSEIHKSDTELFPESRQFSVDPFGTPFEIYIDAPMLRLDETSDLVKSGKLYKDSEVEGRFVYLVDGDREVERTFGSSSALMNDPLASDQSGERKTLSFKTDAIVSAGEIIISSNQDVVVFYDKKFRVQNNSLIGTLSYRRKSDGAVVNVPAGSFVPFEVLPTYNRIGTLTISEYGAFNLRLRGEYKYDWNTDDVKFQYVDPEGNVYEKTFGSLSYLNSSLESPIILELVNE